MRSRLLAFFLACAVLSFPELLAQKGPKPKPSPAYSAVEVVDSLGNKIGDVVGTADHHADTSGMGRIPTVAVQVDEFVFTLGVYKNQFMGSYSNPSYFGDPGGSLYGTVFYTASDCSGPAHMIAQFDNSLHARVQVDYPGQTIYTPDPDATLIDRDGPWYEWRRILPDPNFTCELVSSDLSVYWFIPVLAVINLEDHFTPPFTLNYLGTPLR